MNKLKKNSLIGKIVLIIISLFLGVSLITFNYFAIGRSASISGLDSSLRLTLTSSGDANRSASGFSISGNVSGKGSGCSASSKDGTLEIKYNGELEGNISFEYLISCPDGNVKINNTSWDGTTSLYNSNIIVGGTITIYLQSNNSNKTTINISNIKIETSKKIDLTFLSPEGGYYKVNDVTITQTYVLTTKENEKFTLTAFPNDGFKFAGWNFNGKLFSTESPLSTTSGENATIECLFVDITSPLFMNGNSTFYDLQMAIDNAKNSDNKRIILIDSGTIKSKNGESKTFVLENGVSLLIPHDDNYNVDFDESPVYYEEAKWVEPSPYRKLTLDDHVSIIVENSSSIYVSSKARASGGGDTCGGSPTKTYGEISLLGENSSIVLDNGSILYAYGFITGLGEVNAKNGSIVNELYQINDFKGGSMTSKCLGNVFPFNQYFIQNVECKIIFEAGSSEKVHTGIYAASTLSKIDFDFIGTSNGLFRLSNGARLLRYYDGDKDLINYSLESGTASFNSISLSLKVLFFSQKINSNDYVLPITNNMNIVIKNNAVVDINQDLCFLPGSRLIVEQGGNLNLNDKDIYLYDRKGWVGKGYSRNGKDFVPLEYAPSKKYTRSDADLKSTELNIDGVLNIGNNAGIYTTNSSDSYANVYSSKGTGKIIFNSELNENKIVKQYKWGDGIKNDSFYPLFLRNSMNELVESNDTYCNLLEEKPLSDNYVYFEKTQMKWLKKSNTVTKYVINFYDRNNDSLIVTDDFISGESFAFPSSNDLSFKDFTYNGYLVKKWETEIGLFDAGKSYTLTASRNLNAYALYGGWVDLNGEKYYVDYQTGDYYKGLKKVDYDNEIKICKFKEDGAFDLGYTGTYLNPVDNKYYFIESGVVKEKGFYKYASSLTSNDYNYVFVSDDNTLLKGGTYYINIYDKSSSILPSGTYNFDENGLIIKEDKDTSSYNEDNVYIKNIDNKGDSAFINGIRVGIGLFKDGNYLKYADSKGLIVKNATYYVSKTNNINDIKEGLYYFDNEGRMYDESFTLIEAK